MFIGKVLRHDYLYKSGELCRAACDLVKMFYETAEKTESLWKFDGALSSYCHVFA